MAMPNKIFCFEKKVEMFKTCLIDLKNACLAKGINTPMFILDNARIHHYKSWLKQLMNCT